MRIIAGERRGHRIEGPESRKTRPTSDLVREAIFNILGAEPEGRPTFDLFAGTGALGLEALSRGAIACDFVERDRRDAAVIRRNIATLRYEDRARVAVTDALRFLRQIPERLGPDPAPLIFLDPPYAEYHNHPARLFDAFRSALETLPVGSILVVEGPVGGAAAVALPDIHQWDLREYASTVVAIRTVGAIPPDSTADVEGVDS